MTWIKWFYVKFTGKCWYDGTVLYDSSVTGSGGVMECPVCGRGWIIK